MTEEQHALTADFAAAIGRAVYFAKLAEELKLAGKHDEAEDALAQAEQARAFARLLLGELTNDW